MTPKLYSRYILVAGSTVIMIACAQLETVDLTGNDDTDNRVREKDSEPPFQDTADSGPDSELSGQDSEASGQDSELSDSNPPIVDACKDDPDKTEPGICGCGVPDEDSDGDGAMDCDDDCPEDPGKIEPGICDCGVADEDGDGDGAMDCDDDCPEDPDKTKPGICKCGVADEDGDGDGTMDCDDECPEDPDKTEPGPCGCGVEAFSCWDCLKPEHCEPMEFACASPTCIEGQCGTDPAPKETKCREAIDACDAPEYCTGTNVQCPSDTGVLDSCVPKLPIVASNLGRTITYTSVTLNNTQTTVAYVKPGDSVTLRVVGNVVDTKTDCDTCMTQFYASLEGVLAMCLGNSHLNWSFDEKTTFTAPKLPGIYYINTRNSWEYECKPEKSSLTPNGTVAILKVE